MASRWIASAGAVKAESSDLTEWSVSPARGLRLRGPGRQRSRPHPRSRFCPQGGRRLRSSGCPGVQHQGVNRPPRIALARRWQPSSKHLPSLPLVVQTGVDPLLSLGARQCRRCEMSDRRVGKLGKVNVRRESIGKRHADLAQPQHRDADAGYVNAQEAVELECATTIADYVVARTYLANFFPAGPTTTEAVRGVGWASADSRWGSVKGTRCCACPPRDLVDACVGGPSRSTGAPLLADDLGLGDGVGGKREPFLGLLG
jgi:hypothetical protein